MRVGTIGVPRECPSPPGRGALWIRAHSRKRSIRQTVRTEGIDHAQRTFEETFALQGVAHPDTQDALSEPARQYGVAGDLLSARSIQERVVQTRGNYGEKATTELSEQGTYLRASSLTSAT